MIHIEHAMPYAEGVLRRPGGREGARKLKAAERDEPVKKHGF
jgi:hypothetical protein